MKDWTKIGQVTVQSTNGNDCHFETLDDAVRYVGGKNIEGLSYGHLGQFHSIYIQDHVNRRIGLPTKGGWLSFGDSFVFIDVDSGMIIPVWKVKETYSNLPNIHYYGYYHRNARFRKGGYIHEKHFRNGPVHGIRRYHWHRSRASSHLPWKRAQAAIETDLEELDGYYIKMSTKMLPDPWDDHMRSDYRVKSWKKHRNTQFR